MAIAFTKSKATPNRLVYKIVGDGASAFNTISKSNAQLLADTVAGPLRDLIKASYANTAAVQAVFGGGNVEVKTNVEKATSGFITLASPTFTASASPGVPQLALDSASVPALNDVAYLVIEHKHSVIQ